jgi:OmpA-OmpF porin, OOP family
MTNLIPKIVSLASAVVFPWLCLNCITNNAPEIASMLQNGVTAAIAKDAIAGVTVKADGRDIVLTGNVASEDAKNKAGQEAIMLPGVRTVDNQITVVAAPAILNEQIGKILVNKRIEFESGKDILLPTSVPVLQEVLDVLKQAPGLHVRIAGHTDASGDAASNRALSLRRAQAVVKWFADNGIPAANMKAAGLGPDRPIASNATPDGKLKNRRVEITTAN